MMLLTLTLAGLTIAMQKLGFSLLYVLRLASMLVFGLFGSMAFYSMLPEKFFGKAVGFMRKRFSRERS
jgi:O-antigen ligase